MYMAGMARRVELDMVGGWVVFFFFWGGGVLGCLWVGGGS